MLRRSQNSQDQQGLLGQGEDKPLGGDQNWDDDDQLLRTFEPLRKKWPAKKVGLIALGCVVTVLILYMMFAGGKQDSIIKTPDELKPSPIPTGKQPVDKMAILGPIDPTDRCECRKCKEWREYQLKPWLKPRMDNYVKGCTSHLMEWHQVTSKDLKTVNRVLPGPGKRFLQPGVICDICQKDFAIIGRKLWEETQEVLHSWTCYKCVWEDPDRFYMHRNAETGMMEKKHTINHGIDVCGVCAKKCPDQIRTFQNLGPEGKLLAHAHPHDHRHDDMTNLVGEMREAIKDEL